VAPHHGVGEYEEVVGAAAADSVLYREHRLMRRSAGCMQKTNDAFTWLKYTIPLS